MVWVWPPDGEAGLVGGLYTMGISMVAWGQLSFCLRPGGEGRRVDKEVLKFLSYLLFCAVCVV